MLVFATALAVLVGLFTPSVVNPNWKSKTELRDGLTERWEKLITLLLGHSETPEKVAASTRTLMKFAVVSLLASYVLIHTTPLIGLIVGFVLSFAFADEVRHFLLNNKYIGEVFRKRMKRADVVEQA